MASGKFIKSMFRKKKIFFSVVLVTAVFSYNIFIFLKILWFINHNPKSSAFMEKSIEIIKEKNPGAVIRHKWIPYEKISDNIKKAVIAAEDAKFNYHEGFDWNGIQRAFDMNIKKGKIVAGGSTISQQLAKNLFLSKNRNPFRKAEESFGFPVKGIQTSSRADPEIIIRIFTE